MPFAVQPLPPAIIEFIRTESINSRGQNNLEFENSNDYKEFVENIYIKERFLKLKKDWIDKTLFSSSIVDIVEDPSFQKILQMGEKAIPLIIDDIEKEPSSLVWALNIICKATLKTNSRLTVSDACKVWVKLYRTGQIKIG